MGRRGGGKGSVREYWYHDNKRKTSTFFFFLVPTSRPPSLKKYVLDNRTIKGKGRTLNRGAPLKNRYLI